MVRSIPLRESRFTHILRAMKQELIPADGLLDAHAVCLQELSLPCRSSCRNK